MSPHNLSCFRALGILALILVAAWGARPAAAATVRLKNNQEVTGTIDETASDAVQLVIKTRDAVLKIPRSKIERIDQQDAAPAGGGAAGQAEANALKQAESALAGDPANDALRKKVDELRKKIQSQALLNYGVFFEKLDALMKAQRYDEAVTEAEAIVARISDPGARDQFKRLKAKAHIGLAHRFHEFVNYKQEEEQYNDAMNEDPENPAAPLELGDLLQVSPARRPEAARLYEKGIDLASTHPGTIDANLLLDYEYKLAELFLNERQYVAAGDRFLRVMLEDKQFRHAQADEAAISAYSRLPIADMDATTRTHIIDVTRKILAAKPGKQGAYLLLGRIFFDQQQWTEACNNLTLAVKYAGPRPDEEALQTALFDLAISQRKLRQDKDAAASLQRLLAMRPRHYDALCELAEICMANDSFTEAQNLYEQALAGDAEKHRAHLGKGLAQQNQGKYEEARTSFKAVLEREEKNAPAQLAVARSYFAEKKYDEAIIEGEKALQLIRDHYKKEEEPTSDTKTGTTVPIPGAAGSAEDPLASTTQTLAATPATTEPLSSGAPPSGGTPTTQTLAATPTTTEPLSSGAPPSGGAPTTQTLAATPTTTEPLSSGAPPSGGASTTQTLAVSSTTQTLAATPTTEEAPPIKPGVGGINAEDIAMLDVITPEDRQSWAEANTLIGKCHTMAKRTNQARDYFNVALKFEPKFAEAYEGTGLSYAEDQLAPQAEQNFLKAIELDPQNPQYCLTLATFYHKTRKPADPAKALPLYKQYLALGGRDASVNDRIKECGGK